MKHLRCCLRNGWLTSLVMSVRSWRGAEKFYHNDALILRWVLTFNALKMFYLTVKDTIFAILNF